MTGWGQSGPTTEFAMPRRIVQLLGCSCVFTNNQRHGARSGVWRELLALSDAAAAEGLWIRPIAAPQPIGSLFGPSGTQNPFSVSACWATCRRHTIFPADYQRLDDQRADILISP